jgi:hypothetical protein
MKRKDFISRVQTRLNKQSKENEWGVTCKIGELTVLTVALR